MKRWLNKTPMFDHPNVVIRAKDIEPQRTIEDILAELHAIQMNAFLKEEDRKLTESVRGFLTLR